MVGGVAEARGVEQRVVGRVGREGLDDAQELHLDEPVRRGARQLQDARGRVLRGRKWSNLRQGREERADLRQQQDGRGRIRRWGGGER